MFATIEGPEGAGKSTLAKILAQRLENCLLTREPGEGEFGAKVRTLLLDGHGLTPWSEVFLFLADRAEHVATVIRPALEAGRPVLCDRYTDSTIVYQGYARGLDIPRLRELNDLASGALVPRLTLLLDLDPVIGLSRLSAPDRLDREPLEFHARVREGFLAEARLEPARWHVIDASQPQDAVEHDAWAVLEHAMRMPACS